MKKHKLWSYALTSLLAAILMTSTVLLPQYLSFAHRQSQIGLTTVLPLSELPSEVTPPPISRDALFKRALTWYARENQSSQFVKYNGDAQPSEQELGTEEALVRFCEQQEILEDSGFPIHADAQLTDLFYYRLVHGVTEEYQGYYSISCQQDEGVSIRFILDANTGTILYCEYDSPLLAALDTAHAFAVLWKMEDGRLLKWNRYDSLSRESLIFGNSGEWYIDITVDTITENNTQYRCNVTLRLGTGEKA
jgi:hypothetical protein